MSDATAVIRRRYGGASEFGSVYLRGHGPFSASLHQPRLLRTAGCPIRAVTAKTKMVHASTSCPLVVTLCYGAPFVTDGIWRCASLSPHNPLLPMSWSFRTRRGTMALVRPEQPEVTAHQHAVSISDSRLGQPDLVAGKSHSVRRDRLRDPWNQQDIAHISADPTPVSLRGPATAARADNIHRSIR